MSETFVSKHALDLAPWSVSKLKLIKNCGTKFYMDYVYKSLHGKKHPEDTTIVSKALDMGSMLHEICEKSLSSRNRDLIEYYIKRGASKYPEMSGYQEGITNLYDRITAFLVKEPSAKLFCEHGFGIDLEGKTYDFFNNGSLFRSKFDIVLEYTNAAGEHSVKIIDVKSGKYYEKETLEQLDTYAAVFKLQNPNVKVIALQTALIANKINDLLLTPVSFFEDKDPKKILIEKINSYVVDLPEDLLLLKDKSFCAPKSKEFMCTGCTRKEWCPKFGGTPL